MNKFDLDKLKKNKEGEFIIIFSSQNCNVCKIIHEKLSDLIRKEFPLMKLYYVDVEENKEISAQENIFTVPIVSVYFEGKEHFRFGRNVGIHEIKNAIKRPYSLLNDEL